MDRDQRIEVLYSLRDNFFFEDSKHDFEKYNYGDQYVKNLRKVDVLKSKLKRGKITQEEFDKEYKKLALVKDDYGDEYRVSKNGTKKVNYNRPNKNKPDNSFKNLKNSEIATNGTTVHGRLTNNDGEKFDHYNNILNQVNIYLYILQVVLVSLHFHFKNMCRLLGRPNATTIKVLHGSNKGKANYQCFDSKKSANCTSETKLYHTSNQRGLTRLTGKFRGAEGFYFSSKRVYFHKNNPGGRITSSDSNYTAKPGEYVYQYTGNASSAFVDPEIGGSAVFIETDTSVPVKDVTSEFQKK